MKTELVVKAEIERFDWFNLTVSIYYCSCELMAKIGFSEPKYSVNENRSFTFRFTGNLPICIFRSKSFGWK